MEEQIPKQSDKKLRDQCSACSAHAIDHTVTLK